MLLAALLPAAWGAACPDDPAQLALEQAAAAGGAYDRLDETALIEAGRGLDFAIGCLIQPLPPRAAVEVRRAKALIAFYDGEEAAVLRSWAAVKTLDPTARPSESRWPAVHPMWSYFEGATTNDEHVTLERVPPGGWVVDGVARSDVPRFRAFLLQGLDGSGAILHSGYHYSVAEVPQLDFAELDATARERRRKNIRVIGTSVASGMAVGSVGSFVVAAMARGEVNRGDLPYNDVEGRAVTANTSATLAAGLGVAAVGAGVATWTIRW